VAAKLGDKSQVTVENVLGEIRTQENSTAIYAIKEENGSKGLINETTGISSFPASYLFPEETTGIGTGVRIDVDENLSIVSAGATEVENVEEVLAEIEQAEAELSKAVINLTLKWSNGKPQVGYNATLGTGSSLQYMIGKDGTWKDLSGTSGTISDTNITLGKTVYVVATANGKQSQVSSVEIKDEENPTVSISVTETTTDSITVQVTATDKKSGMPSTPKYTYYLDGTAVSTNNSSNTYTFDGLNSDTSYTIKITTTDNAGNVGTASTEEKTDVIASSGNVTGVPTYVFSEKSYRWHVTSLDYYVWSYSELTEWLNSQGWHDRADESFAFEIRVEAELVTELGTTYLEESIPYILYYGSLEAYGMGEMERC
jgi:archaellum component FlaF (FlaF/FlaG flagellin family)